MLLFISITGYDRRTAEIARSRATKEMVHCECLRAGEKIENIIRLKEDRPPPKKSYLLLTPLCVRMQETFDLKPNLRTPGRSHRKDIRSSNKNEQMKNE